MNRKATITPVTEEKLKIILNDYPTKMDMREAEFRTDEKARQYRDEILTRLDGVMGELAQQREDRVFEEHDVKVLKERVGDHEKRIIKLEAVESTS